MKRHSLFSVILMVCAIGCVQARSHLEDVHSDADQELTVGIVQKEIRPGMSQADVAAALGSPNIVDKDSQGVETWIYDKIATVASYSRSNSAYMGAGGAGGTPGTSLILGLGAGGYSRNAGAAATTQKTLTVIVKFGADRKVKDYSYHSTKF